MNDINTLLPDIKLRFNIDHPSFEECYTFGYECALAEIDEEENPFPSGSIGSEQWLEGWWAGFYGEKPLFELPEHSKEQVEIIAKAANDDLYLDQKEGFFAKVFEISGVIAVTAILGYQVMDLVA